MAGGLPPGMLQDRGHGGWGPYARLNDRSARAADLGASTEDENGHQHDSASGQCR